MSSVKDIRARIVYLLKQKFDLEVYGDDVKEGFTRPCFFVRMDNHIHSSTNYHIEKTINVNIYYYPNDRYTNQMELIDIQRRLESVFDLKLIVGDRHFNIIEIESDVIDGILGFSFDIEFSTNRASAYETMILYQNEKGEYYKDESDNYTSDILDVIKQVGLEVLPNSPQNTASTTENTKTEELRSIPTQPTITPVMVSADRQGNIILADDGQPFIVQVMGQLNFREGLTNGITTNSN